MLRNCAIVLSTLLASACAANGGAVVDVVPRQPGPYDPGEHVEFDLRLTQEPGGQDRFLRMIQFDFRAANPAIVLDDAIRFDYSAQGSCASDPAMCGAGYAEFPLLSPLAGFPPSTVYIGLNEDTQGQITLPEAGTITVASIGLIVPTLPGRYVFDVLNAASSDNTDNGAALSFGFGFTPDDPVTSWFPTGDDIIAGGMLVPTATAAGGLFFAFVPSPGTLVPEPTSAVLLTLGGAATVLRRRRTQTRRSSV